MAIANHTAAGYLPIGLHDATWSDFVARFGGTQRRRALLRGLRGLLVLLADAGCPSVIIGGSFVTTKAQPGDIDVAWSLAGTDTSKLSTIFAHPDFRDIIKAGFGCDCFPDAWHESASGLTFGEFFQRDRMANVVGALKLDLSTL